MGGLACRQEWADGLCLPWEELSETRSRVRCPGFVPGRSDEYAIRYALPDGTKADRRFNASVKRRGVTVRAPTAIADK
jgi:hypothetical protein